MISIPECTLCGKKVEKVFKIEVEGSVIEVCKSCGKYGNIIEEIKPRVEKVFVEKQKPQELEEPEKILKPNYGQLIIQARKKIRLERKEFAMKINEKESVIRRVETQQMTPNEKLRKKIERFLEISLTEVYEEKRIESRVRKGTLTLGDIVEVE